MMNERYEAHDDGTFAYIKDMEIYWQDKDEGTINEIWPVCKKLNEYDKENKLLKQALRESLQANGDKCLIGTLDKLFNLKYDEWEASGHYQDWDETLEYVKK